MKALNCANCGANLNYIDLSPVAYCEYCESINILDVLSVDTERTDSINEPQPRLMLPQEKFRANYFTNSGVAQGGHLLITNTEIFFKPHKMNIGDLSEKYMRISEIVEMEKVNSLFGLSRQLHISDINGNVMELVTWSRDEIIIAIETRIRNLN
jgi:hypothetical protein